MDKAFIITFSLFVFTSCNSSSEKTVVERATNQQKVLGKQFFEYDAIDYYFTNYDKSEDRMLYESRSRSEIDSLKFGVLYDNIPENINDLYFIDRLESIGFKKSVINKSNYSSIDSLFREKTVDTPEWLSCIHVYRDILIFKKQNTVVGTAKICFSCMANQIKGTNANTENFGQEGDYEKLEEILRK